MYSQIMQAHGDDKMRNYACIIYRVFTDVVGLLTAAAAPNEN